MIEEIDTEWDMMDCEGGTYKVMERWHVLFGDSHQVWEVVYHDTSITILNQKSKAVLYSCGIDDEWRDVVEQLSLDLGGKISKVVMNDGAEISYEYKQCF